MDHSTEKWTMYFLEKEELALLRRLRTDPGLTRAGDVIDLDVGVVTGLNEFFVLTEKQAEEYSIKPYTQPIVGRSFQLHYPKIILNEASATCTDTIHRIKFRNGTSGKMVAAAFLNSLTFAFSEVIGRSYGGGVLELEPKEAESLPIPLIEADKLDNELLDGLLREGNISSVLDITDDILLRRGLGLSNDEITLLRSIWQKMRDRRVNRKHK